MFYFVLLFGGRGFLREILAGILRIFSDPQNKGLRIFGEDFRAFFREKSCASKKTLSRQLRSADVPPWTIEILRSARGTAGRCTEPKWSQMVVSTILAKMRLFQTGFQHSRDQDEHGPFWSIWAWWGPFWSIWAWWGPFWSIWVHRPDPGSGSELMVIWKRFANYGLRMLWGKLWWFEKADLRLFWDCSLQSDSEHPIFSPLSKNSRNTPDPPTLAFLEKEQKNKGNHQKKQGFFSSRNP